MGKVVAGFAMSLDGFIADPNNDVSLLYRWFSSGDTPFPVMGRTFMTSAASAANYRELLDASGAHVTGRGDYNASDGWRGRHPLDMPAFIVTHSVPPEWSGKTPPYTFVLDGVESAVAQARLAAGDKNVLIGGSTITQQCLDAGLLDEISLDLVPVLLGAGVRLFDNLAAPPVELECVRVVDAPGVTHFRYRVVK